MLQEAKQAVDLSFHPAPTLESTSNFHHLTRNLEIYTQSKIIDIVTALGRTVLSYGIDGDSLREVLAITELMKHPSKAQVCLLHTGALTLDVYDYRYGGGTRRRGIQLFLQNPEHSATFPDTVVIHKPGAWHEKWKGYHILAAKFDLNSPRLLSELNQFIHTTPNGHRPSTDQERFLDRYGKYFCPKGYNPDIDAGADVFKVHLKFIVPQTQNFL